MKKSAWTLLKDKKESIDAFSKDYMSFISFAKTERRVVNYVLERIKDRKDIFVVNNRGKSLALYRKGKRNIKDGIRYVAAHIDVPRIDLKPVAVYEDEQAKVALMETHYYGGIKKYQWVARPISIVGTVLKEDGTRIDVEIGEDDNDPVFTFADLLPHLARKAQYTKNLGEAIPGEKLDLLIGSYHEEHEKEEKNGFNIKKYILDIIKEKYGIDEEDFVSAELEVVPSGKAREVGFDRSMIGAYGHDDRICGYTAFRAILDAEEPVWPSVVLLFDKEEIGSDGNTGAQSFFLEYATLKILEYEGVEVNPLVFREILFKSQAISADVSAAVNPEWKEVHELKNAAILGHGIALSKYTGHGGKYGANDAHAEYVALIRRIWNKRNVPWQPAELGKVDEGGGGTVAKYLARSGIDTIDAGPALLGMHSPFEIVSKADLYSAYLAYKVFFEEE